MRFSNKAGIFVVNSIIDSIRANRDYLSQVDGTVGDGDHGINMNKGFTIAKEEIDATESVNMSEGFMIISKVLINEIGGSMGPLYGNFFRGLSLASKNYETIDEEVMMEMLREAYVNVTDITTAVVGDKTLIDVLDPSVRAYESELKSGGNLEACLKSMLTAAEKGLESTKGMVAKLGRGSRLGKRTIGYQDAGATSCYIILKSIVDSEISLAKN